MLAREFLARKIDGRLKDVQNVPRSNPCALQT
jgi:hypothetical protein